MNILIVMVGLPRSGKSTWAKKHGAPIVCPDSIRLALHGERFIRLAEPFVWVIAQIMVKALFLAGHTRVIVDGCHVKRKYRDEWKQPEQQLFVEFEWQTWFKHIDTDQQTCLYRAEQECDPEIMPIIDKMAGEFEPLEADETPLVEFLGSGKDNIAGEPQDPLAAAAVWPDAHE